MHHSDRDIHREGFRGSPAARLRPSPPPRRSRVPVLLAVAVLLGSVLWATGTQAAPEERPLYSAQDSLRRAQVGSFSQRPAPPVRTAPASGPIRDRYERLECREDPSRPLGNTFVCEPRRTN